MPKPASNHVLRTVRLRVVGEPILTPRRKRNEDVRPREYLTPGEVELLIATAKKRGRYGQRDATAILIAYRHGLRVSELCTLTWNQVNFNDQEITVKRRKGGKSGNQPLTARELRALRQLRREWPDRPSIFNNERGAPMSAAGFAKMLDRVATEAGFEWTAHPHMLRHACGYKLANENRDTRTIQDYLGHRSIQSTVRYTELSSVRFVGLWQD